MRDISAVNCAPDSPIQPHVYGSAFAPASTGSRGGPSSLNLNDGGPGGGALRVIATGRFTLLGWLAANGQEGWDSPSPVCPGAWHASEADRSVSCWCASIACTHSAMISGYVHLVPCRRRWLRWLHLDHSNGMGRQQFRQIDCQWRKW